MLRVRCGAKDVVKIGAATAGFVRLIMSIGLSGSLGYESTWLSLPNLARQVRSPPRKLSVHLSDCSIEIAL